MSDSVAQDQIKAFVERIERLEEERKAIAGDIAEVYAEAKGNGFDRKALKTVVRIRAMDHNERMEHEAIVEIYLSALGMAPASHEDDNAPHVHVHVREDANSQTRSGMLDRSARIGLAGPASGGDARTANTKPAPHSSPVNDSGQGEADGAFRPGNRHSVPSAQFTTVEHHIAAVVYANRDPALYTDNIEPVSVSPAADARDLGGVASSSKSTQVAPYRARDIDKTPGSFATVMVNVVPLKPVADRPEGCLKPDACAGSWRGRCRFCQKAWDAAHGQPDSAA